jgi:H+/Cl- antiporter ClcA
MMIKKIQSHVTEQTAIFFSVSKWIILSSAIGVIIGAVVAFFLKTIELADKSRSSLPFDYYYLLPFAFIFSVWIVQKFAPSAEGHGTEKVIEAVHKKNALINVAVIPVKLLATVVTIFAGGSVGKEGPGAQIGAGVASLIAKGLSFSQGDRKKLVICGISAGFATVFGTPIAGAIFGIEVLTVGVIMYDVLLPSFIAGFAAFTTSQLLGITYTYYDIHYFQDVVLDMPLIIEVVIAGLFFGFVSDVLVTTIETTSKVVKQLAYNKYLKAFVGGMILIGLVYLVGDRYLGLGMGTIENVLSPNTLASEGLPWYAWIAKIAFTAITLGVGGSGGIVTPIFFIGATSGHFFGTVIGGDHVTLFAALGFVSVVAGATNTPIASTIMAVELFGIEIAHYAALSAVISFLITGHRSVYPSQILAMRKSSILDVKYGEDIDQVQVELDDSEINKIKDIKERLRLKREKLYSKKNVKK